MQLSKNTQKYLDCYCDILSEMQSQMTSVRFSGNISIDFIKQMIPHHRGAIKMSELLLEYTTNIPLQNIALDIISEQRESIESMESIIPLCSRGFNPPQAQRMYYDENRKILNNMFRCMHNACSDNSIDISFMREMIPHHLGAIAMSENALRFGICRELIPILRDIISSQKKGVCQMRELLPEK